MIEVETEDDEKFIPCEIPEGHVGLDQCKLIDKFNIAILFLKEGFECKFSTQSSCYDFYQ